MEKKDLDWGNIGFTYMPTDMRYVADYKDGAWGEGALTADSNVVINECAGILQYCQECFEGLKAYTTEDGSIVTFRPDLNAERMMDSAARLEMPPFPKERFLEAVDAVVKANAAWVPPFGSGATLYLRPYMFASGPVIGVKPSDEYQFRLFATPVGPYFKGGAKSLRCCRKNHIHSFRQFVHIVVFAYVIHNLEHISEYIIIFLIYIASGTIPDNFHILMAKK